MGYNFFVGVTPVDGESTYMRFVKIGNNVINLEQIARLEVYSGGFDADRVSRGLNAA